MSSEERPNVTIYDASTNEVETRPMTDEEYAQWLTDQEEASAESLKQARTRKGSELQDALNATDHWVVRAVEEGTSIDPERVEYRQQLRDLKPLIDHAGTEELEAIEIPEPPTYTA